MPRSRGGGSPVSLSKRGASSQRLHHEQVQQSTRLRSLESQVQARENLETEADYRKIKVCVEDMLRATDLAVDLRRTVNGAGGAEAGGEELSAGGTDL